MYVKRNTKCRRDVQYVLGIWGEGPAWYAFKSPHCSQNRSPRQKLMNVSVREATKLGPLVTAA